AAAPTTAPAPVSRAAAALSALVLVGGALGLYVWIGAPGYSDMPLQARIDRAAEVRATRPDQAAAEAEAAPMLAEAAKTAKEQADPQFIDLMDKLRTTLKDRPDDIQGHALLARNEAGLARFDAAAAAQRQLIALKGDEAGPEDYTDLAEYLIYAAGGYVSPEAEDALTRALQRDANAKRARYFTGLLYAQTGRPDLAFRLWRGLLEAGPEDAPWIAPIRQQIDALAQLAGVRYTPPPATPGPSAADMQAASEMSPEDRENMIRGMVAQLADRLATSGGPPSEWARLIAAYGVLGETDTARRIWTEAQQVFAEAPDEVETIRKAAEQAGVAE
ncbi:tetratricopeptide repeat protein, partial [Oceaniglobus roseus]|uniref:tetratricopeptide repeat protein n=1 Tax=Oceaniglobus roseus TaxID=1737570 RepID=UPI000C7F53C9